MVLHPVQNNLDVGLLFLNFYSVPYWDWTIILFPFWERLVIIKKLSFRTELCSNNLQSWVTINIPLVKSMMMVLSMHMGPIAQKSEVVEQIWDKIWIYHPKVCGKLVYVSLTEKNGWWCIVSFMSEMLATNRLLDAAKRIFENRPAWTNHT